MLRSVGGDSVPRPPTHTRTHAIDHRQWETKKEAGFLSRERGKVTVKVTMLLRSRVLPGPTPGNDILPSATFSATLISITVDRNGAEEKQCQPQAGTSFSKR